jgi:hypothetical protein
MHTYIWYVEEKVITVITDGWKGYKKLPGED